ncbi:MAG: mannose-1-phosphate guanyltransferase, partial [Acidimicrobiales bacterium]
LMEVASLPGVDFAASQDGGFIFPAFLPAYDCVAAFVHTLGLVAATGRHLSSVVSSLPRVHIAHEQVPTPWEKKGSVMRLVVEQTKDDDHELLDGVKVLFNDGWALVLPDPEEPFTHVWAEAASGPDARARAQDQARRIRQMLR